MSKRPRQKTGLQLGFITLGVVMIGFLGIFLFGPDIGREKSAIDIAEPTMRLLDTFDDEPTQNALETLRLVAPGTFTELETAARLAQADGADTHALADLTLQALFGEFRNQALAMRSARSADYQSIMAGLATGLRQLEASDSDWCHGDQIALYLTQNETDLVPSLLAEFPYQSPQYNWAMGWMRTILLASKRAADRPVRHARPGVRDETILQQTGLSLGSEQWALALQIAAFANSEGTSYAKMQEAISNMNACQLGIAVETVSSRLPEDVRARIWADLMPEMMVGNTPYVIWRVNDYFFIG